MLELDPDLLKDYLTYYEQITFKNNEPDCKLDDGEKLSIQDARIVLARIATFLSTPSTFNDAIFTLENKLETKFAELNAQHKSMPNLTNFFQQAVALNFLNLNWAFINNKDRLPSFHHALHEVLLVAEQEHGINVQQPPAKFVGFIKSHDAINYLRTKRTWREEVRISALLFHGKDTHRIQLFALMFAADLGLFDIAGISFKSAGFAKLLTLFTFNCQFSTKYTRVIWDVMIDIVFVGRDIGPSATVAFYPVRHSYRQCFPEHSYISIPFADSLDLGFFMDPYYTHAYLSTSLKLFPHLAACITKQFSKTVYSLNQLENALPFQMNLQGKLEIRKNEISIDETLLLQAKYYKSSGFSSITVKQLLMLYQSKYVITRTPALELSAPLLFKDGNEICYVVAQRGFIFEKNNYARQPTVKPPNYAGLLFRKAPLNKEAMAILTVENNISKQGNFLFEEIGKKFASALSRLKIEDTKKNELITSIPTEVNDTLLDRINAIAIQAMRYVNERKTARLEKMNLTTLDHYLSQSRSATNDHKRKLSEISSVTTPDTPSQKMARLTLQQ